MRIADLSIRRPVTAVMITGSLVVLGFVSLGRLGVDLFPRVEFPFMTVTTVLEGATPETVESEVTDVVEDYVNTISGIEKLTSVSSEGLSQVFIQFELEEDVDTKAQDVRDKVALARPELPLEAEPPVVTKVDPDAAPILSVMVAGDRPIRELTRFADDVVKERVQRIPGVGSAELVGGRDREIRIWLDAERLRAYGLAVEDVIRAIQSEHADVPGGHLETPGLRSELTIKTKGEVEAVSRFRDLVVAFRLGRPTTLGDVARIEDGMADERSYAELDGVRGVALEVRRQSGRNTVEVARAVKAEVAAIQAEAPPGLRVVVSRDVSRFIEASARDVGIDMAIGAFLAVVVTLAFLRSLRSTLIVAVAIPASIVATFFLFYVMDFTLNILTLMALSVSIGLLIDDAIVVLESIHRRIEAGVAPLEAASQGTTEVGGAVIAGTLSVLAVFVPIAFMQGIIGRFFYEYGMAISFAVAVSLLVAVTITPMLCSRTLGSGSAHGRLFDLLERFYARMEGVYGRLLVASLGRRLVVIAVAAAAVVLGVFFARTVPLEFSGKVDRSELEAVVELPLGAGIGETEEVGRRTAEAVRGIPEVRRVFLTIGGGRQERVHEARLYVELLPKRERSVGHLAVFERVRETLRSAAPEAKRVSVSEIPWISGGGFSAYNIEYNIRGPELRELEHLGDAATARMRADPHFVDVKMSIEPGKPEVQVRPDRQRSADLGVSVRSLATGLRALVGGIDVASYEERGSRYDVRLRLEEAQRREIDQIGELQVRTAFGDLVDVASFADLRVETGPSQVDREDRSRKVTLFANTPAGVALGTAADRLDAIVGEVGLPPAYVGTHAGPSERMKDSAQSVLFAFGMALVALYIVLASQFDSFVHPLTIMVSAPLSFVGAFAALSLSGTALNIFAQIGIVALMGLVMKNGILLVDYANQRRGAGLSAHDAMAEAGPVRLRPVLMTAFSTFFGMIPVAISTSDGAEWRNPMGIIVIGGLLSSTFLTLLVVPVFYTLADDALRTLTRLAHAIRWAPRVGREPHEQPGESSP
ncbi:MAG: efflux RND transporter permease subunit [Myxococcota bacterium]